MATDHSEFPYVDLPAHADGCRCGRMGWRTLRGEGGMGRDACREEAGAGEGDESRGWRDFAYPATPTPLLQAPSAAVAGSSSPSRRRPPNCCNSSPQPHVAYPVTPTPLLQVPVAAVAGPGSPPCRRPPRTVRPVAARAPGAVPLRRRTAVQLGCGRKCGGGGPAASADAARLGPPAVGARPLSAGSRCVCVHRNN